MIIQGDRERKDHIHYEFDKTAAPIGVGGMGVVYKGIMVHELTGMVRDVAIKAIHTDAEGAQRQALIEQARREASIRLMNDNLIEMIDFVEVEETRFNAVKKRYYVVSELLHGVSLNSLLEGKFQDFEGNTVLYAQELSKRYSLDREDTAALLIRSILSGIMALHDKGFLHRDIDPSNIMITDDGLIKILDFGIAQKINRLSPEDGLQQEGAFVGKVEYAAPELIKGDIHAQDFSTDIYSIGVLFYKLITGRLPFEGNRFEILNGHLRKRPDITGIKDRKYKAIIERALQKNPKKRYQSSAEMRVALDGANPMPKWVPAVIAAGAGAMMAVAAVVLWGGKSEPVNDTKISQIVTPIINKPSKDDKTSEKSWNEILTILSQEEPQLLLADNPKDPAVLYASAAKALKDGLDKEGHMGSFWSEVLVPEGEVDHWLLLKKEINPFRFAYVSAARAYRLLGQSRYDEEAKKELKQRIEELLETVRNRQSNNYQTVTDS